MKSIKWVFTFVLFTLHVFCYSQKTYKPLFKYIEWADYTITSTGGVEVSFYVLIDHTQNIQILDCRGDTVKSYSYKLGNSTVAKLNTVFNGKKPLAEHLVNKTLGKNEYYAGSYKYITYVASNNVRDSLTTITPFSSTSLESIITQVMLSFNVNRNIKKDAIIISNSFLSSLHDSYKRASYLPLRILPPSQKNL